MNVLVNTKNEQEEKVLLAFLNSLNYQFQADIDMNEITDASFINQYNIDLTEADAAIEAGDFTSHDEVVQLFQNRKRNAQ